MKSGFDRRHFLAGSAGTMLMSLLPRSLWAARTAVPPAPVARVDAVHDTHFGESLSDPYRWMENDKDRDWLPFLKGQNAHARAVLDALPARAPLLRRVRQLSGDTVATSRVQRAGGLTFFSQRPQGADNFKLFVRQGAAGNDRVLIDPTKASGTNGGFIRSIAAAGSSTRESRPNPRSTCAPTRPSDSSRPPRTARKFRTPSSTARV